MPTTKKPSSLKSTNIRFSDLDSKLKLFIFVVVIALGGILTLQLSGAGSINNLQWLKRNSGQRFNFPFSIPQNSGTGSGSGVNCSDSSGSTVTTGNATSGPGGVANTGGNTACGTQ